jgi:phosphodiesterase/alkaline phosphatase D-like protein
MRLLRRAVITPLLALVLLSVGVSFAVATGGGGTHHPPPASHDVYPCVPSTIGGMDPTQVAALIDMYLGNGDGVLDIDQIATLVVTHFGGDKAYITGLLEQFFGGGGGNCEPQCPSGTVYSGSSCVPTENCKNTTAKPCKPKAKTGSYCAYKNKATIYGTVWANGASTKVRFEWGTTTSLGQATSWKSIGSSSSGVALSTSLSGLQPGTTYYYRVVAENSKGTSYGEIKSFKTQSGPPSATTGSASPQGTTATVNGSVNPHGSSTSVKFEYGKSTSLGSSSGTQSAGSGSSSASVSSTLIGLQPNTKYYYRVVAWSSGGTAYGDIKSFTTAAAGPTCTTGSATSITATGAKLKGTVNPNGSSTSANFSYGKSSLGSSTSSKSVGYGTSAVSTEATLTGLTPNTTYSFRVQASNSKGSCTGATASFKTLPNAPTATTGSASNIKKNSATLSGSSNPNGASTSGYFQYGKTSSLGSSSATISFGSGTTTASASTTISNLSSNTTYYYRLVTTNAGGTTTGSIKSFKTASY